MDDSRSPNWVLLALGASLVYLSASVLTDKPGPEPESLAENLEPEEAFDAGLTADDRAYLRTLRIGL